MTKSFTETTDVCLWKGVSPLVSFLTSYHLLNPNITVYSDYILLHLYPLFFLSHHIVPSLRLFTPLNNHLSGHMYSAPILAAGCAPLNPTVMLWPGTDAVDLYTVCCERAPSICKSNLVLLGPLSFAISSPPAPVAFTTLHTLDTELRFNSQNWFSGCLLGWCWIALGLDLSGRQWTVKSGYVLVVLRQCTTNSWVCWLWHYLADTPDPGVIRGLQSWPLQPNHPNEDIWPHKES